ncbi:MAG: translation initiation factor IF-2 [Candidatus Pacebacteria bacterium]|nr:translation initiation factor IF-2 [Candidatus Paceibacterota bacterium]
MDEKNKKQNIISRPPVVVVMGHIDHGKSTLLDYIRKTNIVDTETGGITQSISAYEVTQKDETGTDKKITFLDTPGHEAFSKMRERGAEVADIAILVVSATEGVKPQTIEAWKTIVESGVPFIVAINKIDRPEANVEKIKQELAEQEIYLENYGGKIPFAEISAKDGTGISNLLSLILLMAEMENFTGNTEETASGFVIEVNLDSRRGILATLLIKNGTIRKGMTVAVENSLCSTRIIENFLGKNIDNATFSSPIRIVGFDKMPRIGAKFKTFQKKGEAEKYVENWQEEKDSGSKKINSSVTKETDKKIIPIILKADVSGSIEAIEKEIGKIKNDTAEFRIVSKGIGPISESDIKGIGGETEVLVIGFNVKADKSALEIAQKRNIPISFFEIIYKMTEWLETQMEERRPRIETVEINGQAKIIRAFSRTKERQIVGGKVVTGQIHLNNVVKIMRREFEIGRGKIVNLEKGKVKTSEVTEGTEFGMMLESKIEIVAGDIIESFSITQK